MQVVVHNKCHWLSFRQLTVVFGIESDDRHTWRGLID
jgi:hypothetical protein